MTEEIVPDYIGHRKRVKERFLLGEGKDMADYELLELLIMTALPRRDVKPLAKKLIKTFGSFAEVITAPDYLLREIDGVKDAVITMLKIVKVSAQRLSWQKLASDDMPILKSNDAIIEFCRSKVAYSDVEELHLIYMNSQFKVIGTELIQRGTATSVSASPKEIVKHALTNKAVRLILVHNHPSGVAKPSENDKIVTYQVKDACKLMEIDMIEHIIICKDCYFSFREQHLL